MLGGRLQVLWDFPNFSVSSKRISCLGFSFQIQYAESSRFKQLPLRAVRPLGYLIGS